MARLSGALLVIAILFVNVQSAEAVDFRQGFMVFDDGDLIGTEAVGEFLFTSWQIRVGVLVGAYDPFDHPDQWWVVNGGSLTTSWVTGWKSLRFSLGVAQRFMIDKVQKRVQLYPEFGIMWWHPEVRLTGFIGTGASFDEGSRWQSGNQWEGNFLFVGGVVLTFKLGPDKKSKSPKKR